MSSLRSIRFVSALSLGGVIAATMVDRVGAAEIKTAGATLRELTTDRPDTTESPFTVDVNHLQLELEAVSYTRNRLNGVRTTEWDAAPFNLRYGVTENTEVGIFISPYLETTEKLRNGETTTWRGLGDTTLRAKFNLHGNDGGPTAYGIFVDLKLPTAKEGLGNDEVDGAITFPVTFEVGGGWEGAAMTAIEFGLTGSDRQVVWVNTITVGRELAPDLGGFLELTSAAGDGSHVATFNCGLTRRFGPQLQLDAGFNFGLSRSAPDLRVFAGLSRKF